MTALTISSPPITSPPTTSPLHCPHCGQAGLLERCAGCALPAHGTADLAPHVPLHDPSFSFKQKVMNSRPFAWLYESFLWRPLHTRLSSGQSLQAEITELLDLGAAAHTLPAARSRGPDDPTTEAQREQRARKGSPAGEASGRSASSASVGGGAPDTNGPRGDSPADQARGEPRVVVDLACGTGPYARELARRHPKALVIGLDLSPGMLRQAARHQRPNLRWVRGDMLQLPLSDQSVDHVNSAGTLHLFRDPLPALRELRRVLAPGGLFTLMAAGMPRPAPGTLRHAFETRAGLNPLVPDELRQTLEGLGFVRVRTLQRRMIILLAADLPGSPT